MLNTKYNGTTSTLNGQRVVEYHDIKYGMVVIRYAMDGLQKHDGDVMSVLYLSILLMRWSPREILPFAEQHKSQKASVYLDKREYIWIAAKFYGSGQLIILKQIQKVILKWNIRQQRITCFAFTLGRLSIVMGSHGIGRRMCTTKQNKTWGEGCVSSRLLLIFAIMFITISKSLS